MCQVSFIKHVNWPRENSRSDREKTGKTQGILECNLSGDPG